MALWATFLKGPFFISFMKMARVMGSAVPRIRPQKLMMSVFLMAFQA